jgi:hypothetical protein
MNSSKKFNSTEVPSISNSASDRSNDSQNLHPNDVRSDRENAYSRSKSAPDTTSADLRTQVRPRSVGRRTPQGKSRSSHNALRHGIFANTLLRGGTLGDNAGDFEGLVSVCREAIRPANGLEEILVEKLAVLLFRLTRTYKFDAKIAPKLFARVAETLNRGHFAAQAKWISREDQALVPSKDPTPDLIIRYETSIERQIVRTLEQIEKVRNMRGRTIELTREPRVGGV